MPIVTEGTAKYLKYTVNTIATNNKSSPASSSYLIVPTPSNDSVASQCRSIQSSNSAADAEAGSWLVLERLAVYIYLFEFLIFRHQSTWNSLNPEIDYDLGGIENRRRRA